MRPARLAAALALAAIGLSAPHAARASDAAFDPRDEPVLAACGQGDGALSVLALGLARRRLAGLPPPSPDELTESLREAGDTRTGPRVLTLVGAPVDRADAARRTNGWSRALGGASSRRCGVASAVDEHGREAVVVVAVQELAVVRPIPTHVPRATWISIDASLARGAGDPRIVVLGPRGAPRSILTSFDGTRVVGRFSADREGRWVVQIVADLDDGPRPVAEARVQVGDASTTTSVVPGEDESGPTPEAALVAKVNAARASEGLPALARSPALDEIAKKHASTMAKRGRLAHEVGDGSPLDRVQAAGIETDVVGENVARAGTLTEAHRAIWASPSHRENVLSPRFHEVGIGVVDRHGELFVTELFVGR